MVTYQIKDRLREYLKSIGLSVYQLEVDCGFSRSYFNNMKFNIPAKKIDVILEHLPDLNKTWLLTGEGNMTNGVPYQREDTYLNSEDEKKIGQQERQDIMTRVREAILTKISPSIERYEKQFHLFPGTFNNAMMRGDDRVVMGWLNAVYRETDLAYSFDWLMTGEGAPFRIKQPYIPVIPASVLDERFNINERIRPLDKSWLQGYYCEDVPVNIVYDVDNADFAVLFDNVTNKRDPLFGRQFFCQIVDNYSSSIVRDGDYWTYLVCDRVNGVRVADVARWDAEQLEFSFWNGNREYIKDNEPYKYSIFARIIGIYEHRDLRP